MKTSSIIYEHYTSSLAKEMIKQYIRDKLPSDKEIVILCPGTEKAILDSLGPLAGTLIKERNDSLNVLGTLEEPANGFNITSVIESIHKDAFVIVIDAVLGAEENIGLLIVSDQPIRPCLGSSSKPAPAVGNISICGVTDDEIFADAIIYKTTSLSHVYGMAKLIAEAIVETMEV